MLYSVAVLFGALIANAVPEAHGFSPVHKPLPSISLTVLQSSATEEKVEETKVGHKVFNNQRVLDIDSLLTPVSLLCSGTHDPRR